MAAFPYPGGSAIDASCSLSIPTPPIDFWAGSASNGVNALVNYVSSFGLPPINYNPPVPNVSYTPIQWNLPPAPVVPPDALSYTAPSSPVMPVVTMPAPFPTLPAAPEWVDPGIDISFAFAEPGPAPTITIGDPPTLVPVILPPTPEILAPTAPVALALPTYTFDALPPAPAWTRAAPTLDFSGEPGAAPSFDVGEPPFTSVAMPVAPTPLSSEIALPTPVVVPDILLSVFPTVPEWTRGDISIDYSGAPGGAPFVSIPEPPAPSVTGPITFVGLTQPAAPVLPVVAEPDLSGFVAAPAWSGATISFDLSGQPGPAPSISITDAPLPLTGQAPAPTALNAPLPIERVVTSVIAPAFDVAPQWTYTFPTIDDTTGLPGPAPGNSVGAPPEPNTVSVTDPVPFVVPSDVLLPILDAIDVAFTFEPPSWDKGELSLDFSGAPGAAPTINIGLPPSIVIPDLGSADSIAAPDAINIPDLTAAYAPYVPPVAPEWTATMPTIDTSGAPGAPPFISIIDPPQVPELSLGMPSAVSRPTAINLPTVFPPSSPVYTSSPNWTAAEPIIEYGGEPGAAPGPITDALPYITPASLGTPDVVVAPFALGPVSVNPITNVAYPDAPLWTGVAPDFDASGIPGAKPNVVFGEVPAIVKPQFPDAPSLSNPASPVLMGRLPPEFSGLVLPDLDIQYVLPELPSLALSGIDYEATPYESDYFDMLKTEVSEIIGGRRSIPHGIWEATWSRAVGLLQRQAHAKRREARRSWAKLGWEMPGGAAIAQIQQAETEISEQQQMMLLEQTVQDALQTREDFWKGLEQGVALERMGFDAWNAYQDRMLKAAIAYNEAMIATYNAVVAGFNALLAEVQIKVAVRKMQLEGALAQLDVHRLELESAKISGEIDKNRIEVYLAEWEGIKSEVEVYSNKLRATEIDLNVQKTTIDAFRAQTEANTAVLDAWKTEWDGYRTKVEAENAKLGRYKVEAEVFGERVRAFAAEIQGKSTQVGSAIQIEQLKLEAGKVDADRYRAGLDLQKLNLEAFDANARARSVEAEIEKAMLEAHRLKLQAKELELQAWKTEWEGFNYKLQAQQSKVEVYKAQAGVYDTLVGAWKTTVDAENARLDAELRAEGLKIEAGKLDLDRFRAELEPEKLAIDIFNAGIGARRIEMEGRNTAVEAHKAHVERAKLGIQSYEAEIRGYEAKLTGEKAKLDLYPALASVYTSQTEIFRAKVQGETSRLDADLRAAGFRIDAAKLDIDRYRAEMEPRRLQLDIFNTNIEARKTEANLQDLLLKGHSMAIDTEKMRVDTWKAEWDGYASKVQAQQALAGVRETEARVFGSLVDAYRARTEARSTQIDAQIRTNQLRLEAAKQDAERYRSELERERAKIDHFKALLEARTTSIQVDRLRLDAHKAKIDSHDLDLRSWEQQWKGYESRLRGQEMKLQDINAKANVYQTLMEGYKASVQGETSRVDALVRAEGLKVDIAKVDVDRYRAETDFLGAQVRNYEAGLKTYDINTNVDRLRLDAHKANIETKKMDIDIWNAEWQGYKTKLEAESLKVQEVEARVKAYQGEVSAYDAGIRGLAARIDAQVRTNQSRVDAGRLGVDYYNAQTQFGAQQINAFDAINRSKQIEIDIGKLLLSRHEQVIKARELEVDTWYKSWLGYETKMKAEGMKTQELSTYADIYGKRVDAYQSTVQAENAKLQALAENQRTKVEAAKLGVDNYRASVERQRAETERYEAGVRATGVSIDTQKLLLEAHDLKLRAKQIETDAWAKQWDGYDTKVKAELAKAGLEETMSRVFSAEVQAYQAAVAAISAKADAEAKFGDLGVRKYAADVDRYRAEWEGEKSKAGVYESTIRGAQVGVDAQRAAIDAYVAAAKIDEIRVNTWAKEWDGYSAKVNAESVKAQTLNTYASIFGERMKGHNLQIEGAVAKTEAETKIAQLQSQLGLADLERYKAEWEAIRSRFDAVGSLVNAEATVYKANVEGESARASAAVNDSQIAVRVEEMKVDTWAKQQQVAVAQFSEITKNVTSALTTMSTIYSQLVASANGIYNISQSCSESLSQSQSTSTSASTSNSNTNSTSSSNSYVLIKNA